MSIYVKCIKISLILTHMHMLKNSVSANLSFDISYAVDFLKSTFSFTCKIH